MKEQLEHRIEIQESQLKLINDRVTKLEIRVSQAMNLLGTLTEELTQTLELTRQLGEKSASARKKILRTRNTWTENE